LKKPLRSVLVPQAGFEPASPQITQLPYTPAMFHSFIPKEFVRGVFPFYYYCGYSSKYYLNSLSFLTNSLVDKREQ